VSPIKRHMREYIQTEGVLMRAICSRFGLPWPEPETVKQLDQEVGRWEMRLLLPGTLDPDCHEYHTVSERPWSESRKEFLALFERYKVESAEVLSLLGMAKWRNHKAEAGFVEMIDPQAQQTIRIPHPSRVVSKETMHLVREALHAFQQQFGH